MYPYALPGLKEAFRNARMNRRTEISSFFQDYANLRNGRRKRDTDSVEFLMTKG